MVLKDMAVTLVAVNLVLLPLATITLALRCYTRITKGTFGTDDYLMVFGYVLFAITVGVSTAGAFNGLGVHNVGGTPNSKGLMYYAFWQIFYVTSTTPVKASICISLIRITPNVKVKHFLYGVIAASTITPIIADIVVFTYCIPMAYTWDKTIEGGHCNSLNAVIYLSYLVSAINIVTDWSCAILPAFILRKLQMSRRIKVSVCIMLGMGIFASTATLVRLKTIPAYKNTTDYLYGVAEIAIWSAVEVGIAITAGSIGALRPLFNMLWHGSSNYNQQEDPSEQNKGTPIKPSRPIKLRKVKEGTVTAIVRGHGGMSGLDSVHSHSEDEATSQRGILKDRSSKNGIHDDGSGITVTHSYSVARGGYEANERKTHDLV